MMTEAKQTELAGTQDPDTKDRPRNIVSVVFKFDFETMKPLAHETEYTYFFEGDVKEGDLAVVLSPRSDSVAAVLVVNCSPTASAIKRATKSLIGLVDLSVYHRICKEWKGDAVSEAWERYDGNV